MAIEIHKGKVLKGGKVEVTYKEGDSLETTAEANKKFNNARPHPDLIAALKALRPHAAFLADFVGQSDIKPKKKNNDLIEIDFADKEKADEFVCSGISVSDNGVVLTAQKVTKRGKSMNFNTPLVNLMEDGDTRCEYAEDLAERIEKAQIEFAAFLGGKQAADPQTKMELQ